jgi:hypothetical protein
VSAPKRQNVSPQAAELIARIYEHHAAGCCWHLVLDDDNWDSIEFCREWARVSALPNAEYPCVTDGACQELATLDVTASILARARRLAR